MQNTIEIPAETTAVINEEARDAEREAAEAFANRLRDALGLTPATPRFHRGHDQHLRADRLIRHARERVRGQAPLEGDAAVAAGYSAACAWHRFIYREQATGAALEYVQNLSPWAFCRFLGDLMVAGVKTGATEHTWEAVVSGYRVLANGVVDMDAAGITLRSTNPFDVDATPEWLMERIEKYAPSSW